MNRNRYLYLTTFDVDNKQHVIIGTGIFLKEWNYCHKFVILHTIMIQKSFTNSDIGILSI